MLKKKEKLNLDSMNPLINPENTYGVEVHHLFNRTDDGIGMCLDDFISYLSAIRDKFGNMPVLYFNGRSGCFTKPASTDVDVVKSYFMVSGNLAGSNANIKNENALSMFHS